MQGSQLKYGSRKAVNLSKQNCWIQESEGSQIQMTWFSIVSQIPSARIGVNVFNNLSLWGMDSSPSLHGLITRISAHTNQECPVTSLRKQAIKDVQLEQPSAQQPLQFTVGYLLTKIPTNDRCPSVPHPIPCFSVASKLQKQREGHHFCQKLFLTCLVFFAPAHVMWVRKSATCIRSHQAA